MTIANPLHSRPQPTTETGIPDDTLINVMSSGNYIASVQWNEANDQMTWPSIKITTPQSRSFLAINFPDFTATITDQPNWLQRILWRALGVEWKDLRPERAMQELGKLK